MRRCLAAVFSLALAAPLALAQEPPADFIEVITVTVKPSGVADYEDYVKKVIGGATKLNLAPQTVLTHQPTLGGPGYTYEIVLPFGKWGELDTFAAISQLLPKAYGDVQGAAILKSGRGAVERSQTAVYRLLKNLSSPSVTQTAFIQIIATEIEPEMAAGYELYLAKVKAAQDQTPGTPPTLRYVSVLGPTATYVAAQFFNKFAERDSAPAVGDALRKVHGEAEARQLTEVSLKAVRNRTTYVTAFRPDLSRTPAAAK